MQVLAPSHPLNGALKRTFKCLHVAGNAHFSTKFYLSFRPERSLALVTVGKDGLMDQLERVTMATKNSIRTLTLSDLYFMRQFPKIIEFVTTQCENVTELKVVEHGYVAHLVNSINVFDTFVGALAPRLTSLSCDFPDMYLQTSIHAPSMSLKDQCMPLKKLSIAGISAEVEFLDVLTMKCGETLEELKITMRVMEAGKWRKTFEVIRRNCLTLASLHLESPMTSGVGEDEYVSLLTSYGTQLVSIRPRNFSDTALQNLRDACPNLCLRLQLSEDELEWNRLSVAGEIIEALSVVLCSHHDFNVFSSRLAGCRNLIDLTLKYATNEPAMALGPEVIPRMHQLEKLKLSQFPFHACLNIANTCGPNLKELSIETVDLVESAKPFRSIVAAAPNLEIVSVLDGWERNLFEQLSQSARNNLAVVYIDVARSFIRCRHLRQLNLILHAPVSVEALCGVCQPFRARGLECMFLAKGKRVVQVRDFGVHILR